jgi:hypothetical protein
VVFNAKEAVLRALPRTHAAEILHGFCGVFIFEEGDEGPERRLAGLIVFAVVYAGVLIGNPVVFGFQLREGECVSVNALETSRASCSRGQLELEVRACRFLPSSRS